MQTKTEAGEIKDVAIIDVTPENYIVPKGEEHLYHAVIEVKQFDSKTGKRLSVPRIQKFGAKTFEAGGVRTNLVKQGYDVVVLHDPKKWIAANKVAEAKANADRAAKAAEAKAKAQAEKEKAAAEAQQKAIDGAVAKALETQAAANQKAIDDAVAKALAAATKTTKTADAKADDKK